MKCKYRECEADATIGQFCSTSHKTGYYRDRRLVAPEPEVAPEKVAITPEMLPIATNQDATSATDATSSTPEVAPLLHRAVVPGPLDLNAIKHSYQALHQPITSQHEQNCAARGVNTCNTGPYKPAHELGQREVNRVSLPGDVDYHGVCGDTGKGAHNGHCL